MSTLKTTGSTTQVQTEAASVASQRFPTLVLKSRPQEVLRRILHEMRATGHFADQEVKLSVLEEKLETPFSPDDDETREDLSNLLCWALFEIVWPRGTEEFEKQIKKLLSQTLPSNVDPALFIKSYQLHVQELALIKKMKAAETTILHAANACNSELQQSFERTKQKMTQVNQNGQTQFSTRLVRVTAAQQRATGAVHGLSNVIKKMGDL